jgi:hypothetical protein
MIQKTVRRSMAFQFYSRKTFLTFSLMIGFSTSFLIEAQRTRAYPDCEAGECVFEETNGRRKIYGSPYDLDASQESIEEDEELASWPGRRDDEYSDRLSR